MSRSILPTRLQQWTPRASRMSLKVLEIFSIQVQVYEPIDDSFDLLWDGKSPVCRGKYYLRHMKSSRRKRFFEKKPNPTSETLWHSGSFKKQKLPPKRQWRFLAPLQTSLGLCHSNAAAMFIRWNKQRLKQSQRNLLSSSGGTTRMTKKCSLSHNHGSVENGCISNMAFLSFTLPETNSSPRKMDGRNMKAFLVGWLPGMCYCISKHSTYH